MKQIFESENISFVEITEELIDDYLTMVNDIENVGRYIGERTEPLTMEQEREWVQKKIREKGPYFSMIEKKSGDFIGNIEFMDVHDGIGELGIAITAAKQNMGYGKEAIRTLVDYGKNVLKLKRMFLKAFPYNARALHVYKECGFVEYDHNGTDIFMEIPEQ